MTNFLSTATLPDEYQQLAKTVRDFAQSVVAPVSARHDAEHSFPYEVVAGMAWVKANTMRTVLLRRFPSLEPALRGVANPFAPWQAIRSDEEERR